jgi:DMSO/TMAO reductase YedYZ molybdopterin-dependent catalytic subunit
MHAASPAKEASMRDPASNPRSSRQGSSRLRFLQGGTALGAALVAGTGRPGAGRAQPAPDDPAKVLGGPLRPYGERSRFEQNVRTTQAKPDERGASFTPLDETLGIITPSALHFVVQRGGTPDIDPVKHRLLIHGMVDRPVLLSMEEIRRLPSVSRILFLECSGNSRLGRPPTAKSIHGTHGLTACSEWIGVPLSLLLREAGVKQGATWIVAEGADSTGNERSIPMAKALDDVLVAYGQNGEAPRPENGYPLRLIVPGWEGNVNVKWLRRMGIGNTKPLFRPAAAPACRWPAAAGGRSPRVAPAAAPSPPRRPAQAAPPPGVVRLSTVWTGRAGWGRVARQEFPRGVGLGTTGWKTPLRLGADPVGGRGTWSRHRFRPAGNRGQFRQRSRTPV